jgi:hypothetical protein
MILAVGAPAKAQTRPAVVQVPANTAPTIPEGMEVKCIQGPDTLAPATHCPVLKWNGYTYWAFSYVDDRISIGIVAYNAASEVVAQWEKPGSRYVYAIPVDATTKTMTFAGQSGAKITVKWSELLLPEQPAPSLDQAAGPQEVKPKQISAGESDFLLSAQPQTREVAPIFWTPSIFAF